MDGYELFAERYPMDRPSAETTGLVHCVLEGLTDDTVVEYLGCANDLVKKALLRYLTTRVGDAVFRGSVLCVLRTRETGRKLALLELLAALPCRCDEFASGLGPLLTDQAVEVRAAAAKALAFQHGHTLPRILAELSDTDLARLPLDTLCWAGNPKLIPVLLPLFRTHRKRLPPAFGFLLTPDWLGDTFEADPETASELAITFGYADSPLRPATARLLRKGLAFVSQEMADSDASGGDCRKRISTLAHALLPGIAPSSSAPDINPTVPLDAALFLAAVREVDALNLRLQTKRNPFAYRNLDECQGPFFFFASAAFCRRELVTTGLQEAKELGIADSARGEFLIDRARALLSLDPEARFEADLMRRAKWRASTALLRKPANPKRLPVVSDADFPEVKYAVLPPEARIPASNHGKYAALSPGAQAVVKLGEYLGHSDLAEILAEAERGWAELLPPIGIELQIPRMGLDTSFGWKQALRAFGIPSPRRPEYKATVEAAFRPARTFHVFGVAVRLLHQLGIFETEQDVAMHISIQGDLGRDVKDIVFPQMFMHRSQQPQPKDQMARHRRRSRVMSKGYAHLNRDIEQIGTDTSSASRTEMRVFRCFVEEEGGALRVRPTCLADLWYTHALAAALTAGDSELRQLWEDYAAAVNDLAKDLGDRFVDLLQADWYQSTGDPRDPNLVALMPIIQMLDALKEDLTPEAGDKIEAECQDCVSRHARSIYACLWGHLSREGQDATALLTERFELMSRPYSPS